LLKISSDPRLLNPKARRKRRDRVRARPKKKRVLDREKAVGRSFVIEDEEGDTY